MRARHRAPGSPSPASPAGARLPRRRRAGADDPPVRALVSPRSGAVPVRRPQLRRLPVAASPPTASAHLRRRPDTAPRRLRLLAPPAHASVSASGRKSGKISSGTARLLKCKWIREAQERSSSLNQT
ncbi:hypothetical protein U9M48_037890 [Paspalum notatum var. saurae]|uniref:Uncharacterized protein n=1 Tax=Paspalum notatum var. saurae TaxID=547442 RepID=A0AAQ3UM78_PASNO